MSPPKKFPEQSESFAWAVENQFLPEIIKPGRYASLEWISKPASNQGNNSFQTSTAQSSQPLSVVVSLKSYERSVNDPLIVASRLALIDSESFRVGMTYPFGAEALDLLKKLELAPFSSPDFSALTQAEYLVVPLKNWAELAALPRVLQAANIPLPKAQRQKKANSRTLPKIVAVCSFEVEHALTFEIPAIVLEIFDSVLTLDEFLSSPANILTGQDSSHNSSESAKIAPNAYLIPPRPIVPAVEVSQQKVRFRCLANSYDDHTEVGEKLIQSVKLSGLIDIEIEGCAKLAQPAALADVVNQLAQQIDARKFSLSLRNLSPTQVTPMLAGALELFRRVRIELFAPSLSESALTKIGLTPTRAQLVACLELLQVDSIQSLHLRVELGYSLDESIEEQETIETLRTCANALTPSRGLRVIFQHHVSRSATIQAEELIQNLFENIKRARRIKGVTIALDDSYPALLGAIIERNAFESISEFETFVDTPKQMESGNIWAPYANVLAKSTAMRIGTEQKGSDSESPSKIIPTENETPTRQPSSTFGRRKKRTNFKTVSAPTKTRLRITWSVSGPARFLSHLDNIRAIESALIRSGFALSYTQGQRPRLKISFGAPKPVGFSSECELFDAFFETAPSRKEITALNSLLPPGYSIVSAKQALTKELSILESISHATYLIGLQSNQSRDELNNMLAEVIARSRLPYTRRNKKRERQIDLRPGIFEAQIIEQSDSDCVNFCHVGHLGAVTIMRLTLALTDIFHIRPEEFLDAAGILPRSESNLARIHRLRFGFEPLRPISTQSVRSLDTADA